MGHPLSNQFTFVPIAHGDEKIAQAGRTEHDRRNDNPVFPRGRCTSSYLDDCLDDAGFRFRVGLKVFQDPIEAGPVGDPWIGIDRAIFDQPMIRRKSGGNAFREARIEASGRCSTGCRKLTSSVVMPT